MINPMIAGEERNTLSVLDDLQSLLQHASAGFIDEEDEDDEGELLIPESMRDKAGLAKEDHTNNTIWAGFITKNK